MGERLAGAIDTGTGVMQGRRVDCMARYCCFVKNDASLWAIAVALTISGYAPLPEGGRAVFKYYYLKNFPIGDGFNSS